MNKDTLRVQLAYINLIKDLCTVIMSWTIISVFFLYNFFKVLITDMAKCDQLKPLHTSLYNCVIDHISRVDAVF